jgi:hypothetical protein
MGKSACSARRCGTRNQNKQAPPVLLPKEDTALSHKQPVSGQLHMPVRKPKTACTAVLVQYEFRPVVTPPTSFLRVLPGQPVRGSRRIVCILLAGNKA